MRRRTLRRRRPVATAAPLAAMRRGVAVAILAALAGSLAAAGPAAAQSKTQGNPLTAAANYTHGCETAWMVGGPPAFEAYPIASGQSSCTIYQTGSTTDDTHLIPGTGTVLTARVKSGPNPAPLQITTMRRFFKPNAQGQMEYTCCLGISQTPTFQPTPNAITEVPVNLLVSTQQPANGQTGWWDIVAVSAVGPGSLPIADSGSHPAFGAGNATAWLFPKVAPNDNNLSDWSSVGFAVLMNYDWCAGASGARAAAAAACGGTPPPPPPRDPPPPPPEPPRAPDARRSAPPARIAARGLTLKGSTVGIPVACRAARRCSGTARLRTRGRRPVLLAAKRFAVKPGRTRAVRLALSRKSRRRLAGRRTKVRVELDLGAGGRIAKNLVLVRQGR